jgi:multicomponent Na+:H+ antiporter subunit D
MVLGLGLLTPVAVAGAIFYLVHHVLVKTALFLVTDHLERENGTRDLRQMVPGQGGPWLATAFVIAGFSLAGLPPFSGFFAKLGLFRATLDESAWVLLCVLVIASAYTLVSMLKIWRYAFFGEGGDSPRRAIVLVPLIVLVTVSVSLAVLAGPAFRYAEETARQVMDVDAYVAGFTSAPGRGLNDIGGPE